MPLPKRNEVAVSIKVWGRRTSANVQKVVWALEEIEADYELEERGGRFGGLDDPAYLAMNPNALVPTIRDGDLILWESSAIVRYLAAKYAEGLLYPTDPGDRALVDQWADWTNTRFQPAWIGVFWAAYRTKAEKQDKAVIAKNLAEAGKCFAILDRQLSDKQFLAGDSLTYADIIAGASLYRWYTMPDIERPENPAVAAWYERLQERPGFRTGVMVPYDELRWTV
jgi:glutathione S-transferase